MRKYLRYIFIAISLIAFITVTYNILNAENNSTDLKQNRTYKNIFCHEDIHPDKILDDEIKKLNNKKTEYFLLLTITILIGVLGVTSCTLQLYYKNWARIVTFICGFLISIFTVFTNGMYDYDHRELKRVVHKAESIIVEIKLLILRTSIAESTEDNLLIYEKIFKLIIKLQEVYSPKLTYKIFMLNQAFANSDSNECPKENVCFSGNGLGKTKHMAIAASKILAELDLLQRIGSVKSTVLGSNSNNINKEEVIRHYSEYSDFGEGIISNLNLIESECQFDNERKLYECFTKYSIQKDVFNKSIELYSAYIANQQKISLELTEELKNNDRSDWFVILASFSQLSLIAKPNIFVDKYKKKGLNPIIINSNNYSNLEKGYWVVVLGPFEKKIIAEEEQKKIQKLIPDSYVKKGN